MASPDSSPVSPRPLKRPSNRPLARISEILETLENHICDSRSDNDVVMTTIPTHGVIQQDNIVHIRFSIILGYLEDINLYKQEQENYVHVEAYLDEPLLNILSRICDLRSILTLYSCHHKVISLIANIIAHLGYGAGKFSQDEQLEFLFKIKQQIES